MTRHHTIAVLKNGKVACWCAVTVLLSVYTLVLRVVMVLLFVGEEPAPL